MNWHIFGKSNAPEQILHPAQTCPECGSKLFSLQSWGESTREPQAQLTDGSRGRSPDRALEWQCPNPDCPARVRRGLLHWCSAEAMDIPGADEVMVTLLVKHGLVRDVAELYRLKVKELAALPGMTPESAQKFFDAITASLKRDAWRLLFGLGIPLVGAAESQALGRGFPAVDGVFAAGVPRLMKDAGVSEAVAMSIVRWHGDAVNRKLVRRLEKIGLNFKSKPNLASPES